jgi:DNA helicase-2/ATP-dependent DNA helicase PcrA
MSINSIRELEEERRLLYVAITRAEKHCVLTCAQNRFRYGRMEYDTPSRFIRDIDPQLICVESGGKTSSHADMDIPGGYLRKPGQTTSRGSDWLQNPRPVATQFRADPVPRAVPPRQQERPVDPFSEGFKHILQTASGGRFKPVKQARPAAQPKESPNPGSSGNEGPLQVGNTIEHQRFGIGVVVSIEGKGENQKATVQFRNTGTKQLLLKFARYKIVG